MVVWGVLGVVWGVLGWFGVFYIKKAILAHKKC